MKLESENNMKLHVIKRAHEINSLKKKDQIKMRDYMDRRVNLPTLFFFCIVLYWMGMCVTKTILQRISTHLVDYSNEVHFKPRFKKSFVLQIS